MLGRMGLRKGCVRRFRRAPVAKGACWPLCHPYINGQAISRSIISYTTAKNLLGKFLLNKPQEHRPSFAYGSPDRSATTASHSCHATLSPPPAVGTTSSAENRYCSLCSFDQVLRFLNTSALGNSSEVNRMNSQNCLKLHKSPPMLCAA